MLKTRVIPVVLWDGMNCVQTVQFKRPARVFGSLMDAVRVYERRNVDELILLDIEATRQNREPNFEAVKHFTSQVMCPVTVGGGIKSLDHIRQMLNCGADKVAIKHAATKEFIDAAAKKFGAQAIVFVLDVGRIASWFSMRQIASDAELCGAGEILLTSVERNGTMKGYNLHLIRSIANALTIPVIAHGGCGEPRHMVEAINAGASAAAASTMFLFSETTPRECSRYLVDHDIPARIT